MIPVRTRSRIVNIRLSETEYDEIMSACSAAGIGRFAEYARAAMLNYARRATPEDPVLATQLARIDREISDLMSRCGRIETALRSISRVLAISGAHQPDGPDER